MELLEWKDSLSTQVDRFDGEHKKLVGMINILIRALQEGRSRQIMSPILTNLAIYTQRHFESEENFMMNMVKEKHAELLAHKSLQNILGNAFSRDQEELMERQIRQKYQEYIFHKNEHSVFIKKVSVIKEDFEVGRIAVTIPLIKFLISWVVNHINTVDKKYGVPF